jgi:hypothetical protein
VNLSQKLDDPGLCLVHATHYGRRCRRSGAFWQHRHPQIHLRQEVNYTFTEATCRVRLPVQR